MNQAILKNNRNQIRGDRKGRNEVGLPTMTPLRLRGHLKNCIVFWKKDMGTQKKRRMRNWVVESEGEEA